ncbi:methyltransferase TYW3-domain-containing protein [Diplogelasinospora grovesii]|uniref:tRNA(Phe) 7-[(3-amino-3-carboxypropyl)-4-demethylwyosine(37)-N(4)]-methyltransferase n=1 Tax=Diplogelasinospora grovesii TaxID=303347 RepID=A0AAN6S6S0_9PEZI|nr:methyltransferase TYW3-domain-containing protein [Diplogelasinospora grovesii]
MLLPQPGENFARKKRKILDQLSVPESEYSDASPKGSVDAGIRELIDEINAHAGFVTTSSCAGRVSVFLEGRKTRDIADEPLASAGDDEQTFAAKKSSKSKASSAGGKGGGGEWLFVSHDPLSPDESDQKKDYVILFGLASQDTTTTSPADDEAVGSGALERRLVHFKFEPMILHVLTASHEHAQLVIQAGLEAGFRETGAVSLLAQGPHQRKEDDEGEPTSTPIVAVRSMGLSFESLVGIEANGARSCVVSQEYLAMLVQIANRRFEENKKRIARFRAALQRGMGASSEHNNKMPEDWEDSSVRRERLRREGLRRRQELLRERKESTTQQDSDADLDPYLDLDPTIRDP